MVRFFCYKVQEFFVNTFVFVSSIINYDITPVENQDIYSFNVHESNTIEILNVQCIVIQEDITKQLNVSNILSYLVHHIIDHTIEFIKTEFKRPVIVKFKYNNNTYKICLERLKSTRMDQISCIPDPMILSASIHQPQGQNQDSERLITSEVIEYHGPDRNFFRNIPDAVSDISVLFGNNPIYIFDIMGNKKTIGNEVMII